jgi:hypothetical protein
MGALIVCAAGPGFVTDCPEVGKFLSRYDPEAHGGRGQAWWTADVADAWVFADAAAAFAAWQTVPVSRPVREDGKPNRPLTAFTISVEPAL